MTDFAAIPFEKKLNTRNLMSRVEALERRKTPRSISVNSISELSPNLGYFNVGDLDINGMLDWIIVTDYNAAGDGVTDDTAAINNAIADLNTAGRGVLYFPAGTYLTSGGFTISANTVIMGAGCSLPYTPSSPTDYVTRILCNSATATLFTVSADFATFQDLALANIAGSTPSAGAGITVTSSFQNQRVNYDNISIYGFYINIDVQVGNAWSMVNCAIIAPVLYGVKIRNTVTGDAGDWSIIGSWFSGTTYNSDAGIRIESAGGGKIVNCKFNGVSASASFLNAIDLASTVSGTGRFQVSNCSIENVRLHGIKCSGTAWHSLVFSGNQFGLSYTTSNNSGNAINIGSGYDGITIVGNTFAGGSTPTAISITGVNNVVIAGNVNRTFSDWLTQASSTNVLLIIPGTTVTAETSYDLSSSVGTSGSYARQDHTHGSPSLSTATPADVGSSGSAGSGTTPSKNDHVHRGVTSVNGEYGAVTVTSPTGQVEVLSRWNGASSQTTFELPDLWEEIFSVIINGVEEDPANYALSSDRTQIVLASGLSAAYAVWATGTVVQV